jgi:hypothetical protein
MNPLGARPVTGLAAACPLRGPAAGRGLVGPLLICGSGGCTRFDEPAFVGENDRLHAVA